MKKEKTQEEFDESLMKSDITRLKNLLRNYRDHRISKRIRMNTFVEPVKIIEYIDNAINIVKNSL